jgi:hypothetical protein
MPEDPNTVSNPHRFGPPTGIPRRHRREEEEAPHLHTRAKLERLRSARLIHSDQKTTTRRAMTLSKAKGHISLLEPIKYY